MSLTRQLQVGSYDLGRGQPAIDRGYIFRKGRIVSHGEWIIKGFNQPSWAYMKEWSRQDLTITTAT
jgi:hypothetical protein